MSELREKIRDVVYEAMDYADSREPRIPGQWDSVEDTSTDRIIAAVNDAMLSDEAVEAAVNAGYKASVNAVWGANEIERTGRQIVAVAHRAGLQASLAAAFGDGQATGEGAG